MLKRHATSDEVRRMYASEKLNNFRWIFKILGTRSSYLLTDADRAAPDLVVRLAELGKSSQFADIAYSIVPLKFLFDNVTVLLEAGFPLEGYNAIQGASLVTSIQGSVGRLPAMIVYRPSLKQLVVAISGTSSLELALHDLRALRCDHPSRRGKVHSGFWALYNGLKLALDDALEDALEKHDVSELIFTGHSLGGSISYLACMDFLSADSLHTSARARTLSVTLAAFGAPRTGDTKLVEFWKELVAIYRRSHGAEKMIEYSVRAYNDGVPSLPPLRLGYRHFAADPFYLDQTRLYHVPHSECEHALFETKPSSVDEENAVQFPKGGHNYYNGRDFERHGRRIGWLHKANIADGGWEERYRKRLSKTDI
ncbi:hypothetical protein DXG01_011136 [Tephrocybe rancida]|nr:hypothetical protein DXG01_011136 [Tephrocybe rancida]